MFKIDFDKPIHIHFIGIGGISMSALAEILHKQKFTISGSDVKESDITKHLETLDIHINYQQIAQNITQDIDLVVYTAAIKEDNEEYVEVIRQGIPHMDRASLLGQIMACYEYPIGVSGTHGKTTTTSMLSQILLKAELDPTLLIGGILDAISGNLRIGHSEYFVTEACEYHNSFLKFNPKIGIILNVDADHLDFFKDIHEINNSFRTYCEKIPSDGTLIINGDMDNTHFFTNSLNCQVITYGFSEHNDYCIKNITYDLLANGQFDLYHKDVFVGQFHLNVTGAHNVSNAVASIIAGIVLSIPLESIKKGIESFGGTQRRFELKGEIGGLTIIDDYAHHPTEIRATLEAALKYPHKDLWCVFQPHTYTRTKAFLKEFSTALNLADKVVLTDIYAAREKNLGEVHSKDLLTQLETLGKEAYYFQSFDEIENFILTNCSQGDMLITMGAGDVKIIGEKLLGR